MMPASKHGDPQLGIDIHLCIVPPSPSPVPLPTPHISLVFDPFDYVPFIGATVTVCGMKRATAGTGGLVIHIPPGFPFAPKFPAWDDELFMGSATVVADGDPFSFIAVPVLGCQIVGMPSIPRLKKFGKRFMLLPTTFNLAIPTSVVVGGPPTISLMGLAFKGAFAALGKFAKSGLFKRIRQKLFGGLNPGFLKCAILRAEPVNILTGEVSVQHEDFSLPGRIPIEWGRSYTSGSDYEGLCGHGWETPADMRLEIDPIDGVVSMRHPTAGPLFFPQLPVAVGEGAGELEMVDGARLIDHGSEYQVRTKEDRVYHFPKALARVNRRGGLEYPIGRIADLCGNWLEFDRHGGTLTGINEPAGRRLELTIADGRLRAVTLTVPESDVRHTYVRYEYDPAGDLVAVIDALGHPYQFAYAEHHMVRHTDRNGLSFYYEYDTSGEDWRVVHTWGDGGLYNYRFEYSDVLKERRITDSLGNVSVVTLDDRGLPICEIDALGGRTIYEYDESGRTTAVVDQDGHRMSYSFDDRGNLLEVTRPDGGRIATEFSSSNKPIAVVDPSGAVWRQRWDARGLLIEQATPLDHVSSYEYDDRGQLVVFKNPRGARTELGFDASGDLVEVKDAFGQLTRFTYDILGNVTNRIDALERRTLYGYDASSRLTHVRLPSGAMIRCSYDGEGNLVRYLDENGRETRLDYFGQGEIARRVQPDGGSVSYEYNSEEQLIGVTNQRGEAYRLKRDALGRVVEEIDYWGQSRHYRYSPCGHVQQSVDPSGRVIAFTTDPLGRVLRKRWSGADAGAHPWEERFEYDANGNLIACRNPHVRIERQFDAEGFMLAEQQGERFIIRNVYDEMGNRTERITTIDRDGERFSHRVTFAHDLLDRVTEIAVDDEAPITIERDASGQIIAEQLSHTLRRDIQYNIDGYRVRQRVSNGSRVISNVAYAYDAAGNLIERRDDRFGVDRYTYDPMGRITQQLDPQGRLNHYFADPAGDRMPTMIAERAGHDPDPRLWSRDGQYEGTRYRFDRAGNLVSHLERGRALEFTWDANQRMTESRSAGQATRYHYDPLGRRIAKRTVGARSTWFAWDGDALVAEISDDASATEQADARVAREWVYYPETFEPLAVVVGTAAGDSVLFFHTDPNGCPTQLTDAEGDTKWAVRYSVGGSVDEQLVGLIENPLRLQGQYFDVETGLHYNRSRYYDPATGQYVSQDPLGLEAGVSVYGYAPNTIAWIDPLGLTCQSRLRGRVLEVFRPGAGWQTLVTIPPGATRRKLHPVPGGATRGFEYKWHDGTQTWRVRIHDADPSAPVGSNAHSGWVARVQRGSQYADDMGTFHPPGIHNPASPFHNPTAINDTHIPFRERQRFPR